VDAVLLTIAALAALAVGLAAGLAHRATERAQHDVPSSAPDPLPPGAAQVLAILPSLAVVLDLDEAVVKASPLARALGVVRADRLQSEQLLRLVAAVRRDGQIREAELELPRGPVGEGVLPVSARVAHWVLGMY
jgi:two-component system sensor histidine kinase SenX3